MSLRTILAAAVLASACGGTEAITFQGTVRGQAFKPTEALSTPANLTLQGQSGKVLAILLDNNKGICQDVSATPPKEPKNSEYLVILLAVLNPSLQVVAPTSADVGQTFSVWAEGSTAVPPSARFAIVIGQSTDAACTPMPTSLAGGYSGTVKLTALGADNSASITFDLNTAAASDGFGTLAASPTPERATGAAQVTFCDKLGVFLLPSRGTTCF